MTQLFTYTIFTYSQRSDVLGEKILQMLQEEIPKAEFERYIKNLAYDEQSSKADEAVYVAPNLFIANWVKTKYRHKIAQLFKLQTGIETSVKIVTKKGFVQRVLQKSQNRMYPLAPAQKSILPTPSKTS